MIVVTGATGALNGATAERLLERLPADQLGVSARDVSKARHFADRGVRVRQGSYDDPAALRDSFAGADQVLLVSSNDGGADVVAQHRRAIEAAVAAGVQRILYTSQVGVAPDSPYVPAHVHAATESILADSGVGWTALRYGFFGNLEDLLGSWQRTGVIAKPAAGPFPWTERADLAEAAAVLIASRRTFDGPVTLAASPVTFEDFASLASELTGRTIERRVVDDEIWLKEEIASGMPEFAARLTLSMFQATREGYFAGNDPLLAELLGREPRGAADQLADLVGR